MGVRFGRGGTFKREAAPDTCYNEPATSIAAGPRHERITCSEEGRLMAATTHRPNCASSSATATRTTPSAARS